VDKRFSFEMQRRVCRPIHISGGSWNIRSEKDKWSNRRKSNNEQENSVTSSIHES
jgi:hypothetical protein